VIGISSDKVPAQEKFIKDHNLNFTLLADDELKMIKALGVQADKGMAAKRVTFVIDKQGKIAKIYEKVTPASHAEEVVAFVKEKLTK